MFERLVNLLPILKDLSYASPNVEFSKKKTQSKKAKSTEISSFAVDCVME
jgi:hypothetical protein